MVQKNQKVDTKEENQEEKRVVFFEGSSWYHRTKELMDDMTTKYSKKVDSKHRKRQRTVIGNMKIVTLTGSGSFR